MDSTDTTPTASGAEEFCDVGIHWFSGEVMEVRTDNGRERSDLVSLTGTCGDHAGEVGAKPRRRWAGVAGRPGGGRGLPEPVLRRSGRLRPALSTRWPGNDSGVNESGRFPVPTTDKLAQLHHRLVTQVEALMDSQVWKEFLNLAARFHRYSTT